MRLISRLEEIILLSIWRLQDNAYGITILEEVKEATGKTWMTGSIYASLGRLLKQGLLVSAEGEPSAERGGRRKIFYRLSHEGQQALMAVKRVNDFLWTSIPPLDS
ncbi:MAG: PadR family transcriptional regulator [Candidatus Aminicenantes bacterium]|nr:PadR family transcriptional regulator [Candidatus Aminicenantes bacterium]